jgi:hypothetical protein
MKKWESIAKYSLKKNYIAFEQYIAKKKHCLGASKVALESSLASLNTR